MLDLLDKAKAKAEADRAKKEKEKANEYEKVELTEEIVRLIKIDYQLKDQGKLKITDKELARKHKISVPCLKNIRRGQTWKHVEI